MPATKPKPRRPVNGSGFTRCTASPETDQAHNPFESPLDNSFHRTVRTTRQFVDQEPESRALGLIAPRQMRADH